MTSVAVPTIGTRSFLAGVSEIFRSVAPPPVSRFAENLSYSLVQYHLGHPKIHYEIWVQRRRRRIELGLHFEADAALNRELLRRMLDRESELLDRLGPEIEFEQWDRGWTRVHESLPAARLDLDLAEFAAVRLAQYVEATQDIIADLAQPAAVVRHQARKHRRPR